MRYLGNKDKLVPEIVQLLRDKRLINKGYIFFDAFCGTGAVANSVKDMFSLVLNDSMHWSVLYSYGRIVGENCNFQELGFDPFSFLNSDKTIIEGFFYKNYSPGGSTRMYFTPQNAGRIDFFRQKIEEWNRGGLLSGAEYAYLIYCLIEAVSFVSNTAGVYGAFLKHWDNRANNEITINPIPQSLFPTSPNVKYLCERAEKIISEVNCDVLYLDPPYTQNQYGTQYHLLETLVLNDTPSLSKITGSRPVTPMKSLWSDGKKVNVLFDEVIAKTKARYIVLSYNNDGLMTKDFVEATFKRYGKAETYECREICYKKYSNAKCHGSDGHLEYLFFVEKKSSQDVLYESPLNYSGSKAKMMDVIKSHLPHEIETFVDVFGGGFNVGINATARRIVYNDINGFIVELMRSFSYYDANDFIEYIQEQIVKYDLGPTKKEGYLKLRSLYNATPIEKRDPRMLYTLILFGFQQQVRFNSDFDFNIPCGSRRFNDRLLSKFVSFTRFIKGLNVEFKNESFRELLPMVDSDTFLYLDPPYRETTATYNDGKRGFEGWGTMHEMELCKFLNETSQRGAKFMLSYVIDINGFHNKEMEQWATSNDYHMIDVAHAQGRYNNRNEVLIMNY